MVEISTRPQQKAEMVKRTILIALTAMLCVPLALTGCAAATTPAASPASTKSSATSPAQSSSTGGTSGDLTTVPKDCPEASEVSALVGYTVAAPIVNSDTGLLACTYAAGTQYSKTIEINFQTKPSGETATSLRAQFEKNVTSGSSIAPLSGFGEAAFTNSGSGSNSGIIVLNGGVEFSVSGGTDLEGVERVAKIVLAGPD
jgi:hypothetical protein